MCRGRMSSIVVAVGLTLCAPTPTWADDLLQRPAIEAIWRVQHVDFAFTSTRHFYACDALKQKLRLILIALGAHDSVTFDGGCRGRSLVNQMTTRISLAAPVAATEENIHAATRFDARDELVARLHGAELPSAADVVRFSAAWRAVSLTRHRAIRLDAGDCELMNEVHRQILPMLNVKTTSWSQCTSQARRIRPVFKLLVLAPIAESPRHQLSNASAETRATG